ncbi:MAG: DUF3108 domain-containing protein [Betaproteobacteria bacterium]|nr:DUF3108 domain-containing protein [Betaproteobacteria bacterium]
MTLLWMKRAVILLCMMTINLAIAAPKKITLEYELERDGQLFANVTEYFTQDGKLYQIESVTKGIGIYALLGKRELKSNGVVTKQGLKPLHFESLQSTSAKRTLINDFDWENQRLNMQVKGRKKEQALQDGTQDLLSIMYQFMFKPPMQTPFAIPLTIGKKLSMTDYEVTTKTQMKKTKAGNFDVVTLTERNTDEPKIIYLAKDHHYLPVKVVMYDDGAKFEQNLIKLTVE